MILTLTAEQIAFFSKNGYLELEDFLTQAEITAIAAVQTGRDLWRSHPPLKKLLASRKMGTVVFSLLRKERAFLGLDHKFDSTFFLSHPEKLKKRFCVQGISLFIFFQIDPPPENLAPKLGVLPFCKQIGNILIVKPDLLIDWPKSDSSLYLAGYASSQPVFIDNLLDEEAESLKNLGYEYGDLLRNETHPLLQRANYR